MYGDNLKYALRILRKSPAFLASAAATIALGIGASTAIFSVVKAVLLRPLPYQNPGRLVEVTGDMQRRNFKDMLFAGRDYLMLRDGTSGALENLAAVFSSNGSTPGAGGRPEEITALSVSTNFLRTLGIKVAFGRDFLDSEGDPDPPAAPGATPGATPQARPQRTAILSYEYWQRRYGGSLAVLGTYMEDGGPLIAGILPPHFQALFRPSLNVHRFPDMLTAAHLSSDASARRNYAPYRLIGRLRSGATIDQARAQAERVSAELRAEDMIYNTSDLHIRVEPMGSYLVTDVRPSILALMGAVIFILLIACANVANLFLVRASSRERELAVRTALGGTVWRLIGQTFAEAALISAFGTLIGVGLAWLAVHELLSLARAGLLPPNLPRIETIGIDPGVLVFAAAAGLVSAALFGAIPALRAARPDVMQLLRGCGRNAGLGGGRRLRNGVVVAEVALSFVLLTGCGLMLRSFLKLQKIDPGYDPSHVLTFQLDGGRAGYRAYSPEERAVFLREVQGRLAALPGVKGVAESFPFPLAGSFSAIQWGTADALADATRFRSAEYQFVLPGYFEAMRTRLLDGRTFTADDNGRNVVVIDEALAAKAFPGERAVGKRLLTRLFKGNQWIDVIGVVAHQRNVSFAEPGREQIYFTDGFVGKPYLQIWGVRTAGDPARYAAAVRAAIASIDPQVIVLKMQPMEALVAQAQSATTFPLLLISVFAAIAALLAGVGLYGVLSTAVRQRTAEIGVRMALGADPRAIFTQVVGEGLRLSAAGIAIGAVAAWGLTRAMTSMLVEVAPTDPAAYAAGAVFFFAIAIAACWAPASRAAGLDPSVALREE